MDRLAAFGAMEEKHGKEIRYVLENLREDVPTLIGGDFNSISTFQAPTLLRDHGFTDSFAEVNEHPDSHATWHWPSELGEWAFRIDYIFHTPELKTLESRVVKGRGSDHYPVVSRLQWLKDPIAAAD